MSLILYFLCCILQSICLPVPEMFLVLCGMRELGSVPAFFVGVTGKVIGIGLMYFLAGHLSNQLIKKRHYEKGMQSFRNYIRNYRLFMIGVLFIVPVLPDEVVSTGAALVGIPFVKFMIIAIMSKIISIGMITFSEQIGKVCTIRQWQVILVEVTILFLIAKRMQRRERSGG